MSDWESIGTIADRFSSVVRAKRGVVFMPFSYLLISTQPFLAALTDLDLKPAIVYHFFHISILEGNVVMTANDKEGV